MSDDVREILDDVDRPRKRYLIEHETLHDLARSSPDTSITLGSAGDFTGVVWPFDITAGQIMSPTRAREIAAQLLLMADLHDDIREEAFRSLSRPASGRQRYG